MKIPKTVKFLGIEYKVGLVEKLDHEDNWGRTSYKYNTIDIEEKLPKDKIEQTFIHELLHIAFNATGLDWDRKKEEKYVRAWADSVYGILKENNLFK